MQVAFIGANCPVLDAVFADENASATTLYDCREPTIPAGLQDFSDEQPLALFHPLLYPSDLLDSIPDNLGLMDYDGMNVSNPWDDARMGGNVNGV